MDILKENWLPTMTIAQVLMSVYCLLIECNPNDPLVGSIARQYLSDKVEHDRIAKEWTKRFAS